MKKPLILMSMLLGIGAIGMFVLAGALNFGIGWTIGLVIFSVAVAALAIAFLEFIDGGTAIGYGGEFDEPSPNPFWAGLW